MAKRKYIECETIDKTRFVFSSDQLVSLELVKNKFNKVIYLKMDLTNGKEYHINKFISPDTRSHYNLSVYEGAFMEWFIAVIKS